MLGTCRKVKMNVKDGCGREVEKGWVDERRIEGGDGSR
jgi:hypothetical protein